MKPLYIIPARGGSKGIPRKNIRCLGGHPLIYYSIQCGLEASKVHGGYILFSTDDEEIAQTAVNCGISVDYMRPEYLGADTTSSRDVMLDAMAWADGRGIEYDCIVLLQPTSPLRTSGDVVEAIELYTPTLDMVVSVCSSDANPYYNLFEADADGYLHICKGPGTYTRRQDAPAVLEYNGAVYVINPASLRRCGLGEFRYRVPYVMPVSRSIDLDTLADWERAEQLFEKL